MQKGIMLDVRLWVAGEAEPTSDWAALTEQAVRAVLAAGQTQYPNLTITVLNLAEQTNFDDYEWDRSVTPPLPRLIGAPAPVSPPPPVDPLEEIN